MLWFLIGVFTGWMFRGFAEEMASVSGPLPDVCDLCGGKGMDNTGYRPQACLKCNGTGSLRGF